MIKGGLGNCKKFNNKRKISAPAAENLNLMLEVSKTGAFKSQGEAFDTVSKTLLLDVLPDLQAPGGLVIEKLEGLAKLVDGDWIMVTDNDGVDGSAKPVCR